MSRQGKVAEDLITVKEFYRLVPDGQKADLLDGVIYMASPDTLRSNDLTSFLLKLLGMFNEIKNIGGWVLVTRYAFILSKHRAPEPDVAYVRPERVHLVREKGMKGGPDIAVEIVSRDSRSRDYGEKMRIYQKAGVQEYWIIDPLKNRAEFHRLKDSVYELASFEANHIFRSEVLPGFWLDVNWLLAKQLPNSFVCLQKIFGKK